MAIKIIFIITILSMLGYTNKMNSTSLCFLTKKNKKNSSHFSITFRFFKHPIKVEKQTSENLANLLEIILATNISKCVYMMMKLTIQ